MKNDNEYLEPKIDSGKKEEIIDGFPDDIRTDTGKGLGYFTCDGTMLPSMDDVRAYNEEYYNRLYGTTPLIAIFPGQYRAEIQLETEYENNDEKGMTL